MKRTLIGLLLGLLFMPFATFAASSTTSTDILIAQLQAQIQQLEARLALYEKPPAPPANLILVDTSYQSAISKDASGAFTYKLTFKVTAKSKMVYVPLGYTGSKTTGVQYVLKADTSPFIITNLSCTGNSVFQITTASGPYCSIKAGKTAVFKLEGSTGLKSRDNGSSLSIIGVSYITDLSQAASVINK